MNVSTRGLRFGAGDPYVFYADGDQGVAHLDGVGKVFAGLIAVNDHRAWMVLIDDAGNVGNRSLPAVDRDRAVAFDVNRQGLRCAAGQQE